MSWINSLSPLARRAWRSGLVAAAIITFGLTNAGAQAINEGFEDLATLLTSGDWFTKNQSDPINAASPGWFQCPEGGTQINPAHQGPDNSCVASNFAAGTGTATISTWLIAPNRTFNNGDEIRFWTREIIDNPYPNRMQVLLSTNGTSTNTGTGAFDQGDFTEVLLDINPDLIVGKYPFEWSEYIITLQGLSGPTSGRFAFRFFVTDGGPSGANSYIIGVDTLTYTPASAPAPPQHVVDYNGDGRTDLSLTRSLATDGGNSPITWLNQYINTGGTNEVQTDFGNSDDDVVPLDYDGDQKTDIAVYRVEAGAGQFRILQSSDGTVRVEQFGDPNDDPSVTADYTGDGKADPAIWRPSTGDWWYLASDGPFAGQQIVTHWGQLDDRPAPGDYNGDGMADFAIARRDDPSSPTQLRFWIRNGTGGPDPGGEGTTLQWGSVSPFSHIVPGDYDGDGKTDIAVAQQLTNEYIWYVKPSGGGADIVVSWGDPFASDDLVPGDYDGDGRTDFAVWREAVDPTQNWFYIRSATGAVSQYEWGQLFDRPVANYNVH